MPLWFGPEISSGYPNNWLTGKYMTRFEDTPVHWLATKWQVTSSNVSKVPQLSVNEFIHVKAFWFMSYGMDGSDQNISWVTCQDSHHQTVVWL